ncbi:MAG: YhgE/Pip family protein [Gleimia sp.]|jgi:putative membrane protein|nr:YhgE/Pip domain-containing protein [Acidobacteriota bacterium]
MKMTLRDWRAIVAVMLLPVLAAALTLWSISDRSRNFDQVPAAIVNLDEGTTMVIDGVETQVPLGRELVSGLMYPKEKFDVNLDWQIVLEDTAKEGLEDGKFEAILTIPKDFSKNVASMGTVDATPALITVTSNDASSELMGIISAQIAATAADSMGSMLTEQMLDGIYLGFNDMKDQLSQAADGAQQLDDGAKQMGDGVGQLSDGAHQLADGTGELADGLQQLASGTNQLNAGVGQLYGGFALMGSGADFLADGLQQFRDGFVGTDKQQGFKEGLDEIEEGVNGPGGLAEGTTQLADGTAQLEDGINQLVDGLQLVLGPLADIEAQLPDDLLDNLPNADELKAEIERIRATLENSEALLATVKEMLYGSDRYEGVLPRLQQAVAECPVDETPEYCAVLAQTVADLETAIDSIPDSDPQLDAALDELNQMIEDLGINEFIDRVLTFQAEVEKLIAMLEDAGGFEGISDELETLRAGVAQLNEGAAQLRDGVNGTPGNPGLADGLKMLSQGAAELQAGLDGTANQMGLVGGARQLADGINQSMPEIQKLVDGVSELADGTNQIAGGAGALSDGSNQLAGGIDDLYDGIQELIAGTSLFASELKSGADQVPTYTDAERTRIVQMGAIPVLSESAAMYKADSGANATFPWAAGIVLWLGAFGTYLAMPGLRKRELASSASPARIAWNSYKWAGLIGLLQAIGVGVVATAIGVRPNDLFTTTVLMIIAALSFAAINQALLAVAGARVGRVLALLFLVVQVVSLGGVIPIETAPSAFQALSNFLPLSYVTEGLTHTVVGGKLTSFFATAVPLILWGLVAYVFTLLAAGKARQMDLEQIRLRHA